ncbi:Hint domain-containing protein [Sinirhodobacter huangdaonensis]|uniref:Hint domain-containing protein n=1 Tax=Paenirhodobacter huangdaonensis TaxID=2501515 RepID=UPI00361E4165
MPCFSAGTLIRTSRGEGRVETLRCGDLVLTLDNDARCAGSGRVFQSSSPHRNQRQMRRARPLPGPGRPVWSRGISATTGLSFPERGPRPLSKRHVPRRCPAAGPPSSRCHALPGAGRPPSSGR